jgi:serine/threonine protein kinase
VLSTSTLKTFKDDDGSKRINNYKIIRVLGKGSFASVILCQNVDDYNYFALKRMNKESLKRKQMSKGRTAYDCVIEETKVLQQLEHPNIIWLHEIINDPHKKYIYLVTEYHAKGSISELLKKENTGLKSEQVRKYLIQLLKALYYCHKVIKVIHRDIKPDNIVLNNQGEAVLIDFGVSQLYGDTDRCDRIDNVIGTKMYYAPEMVKDCSLECKIIRGEQTDIWALGITIYEMLTGFLPYKNISNLMDLRDAILFKNFDFSEIEDQDIKDCL